MGLKSSATGAEHMTSINNSTFLKGEEEHKQQEQEGGVVGRHTRLAGGELVGG